MKVAKKIFFILTIVVVLAFIACFAGVNDRYVSLNLIFGSTGEIPIWLLTLFVFLAGIIFAILLFSFEFLSSVKREKRLKKELEKLKGEISRVRGKQLSEVDEELLSQKAAAQEEKISEKEDQKRSEAGVKSDSGQAETEKFGDIRES